MPNILLYEKVHKSAMSRAAELLGVDDEIDAFDNQHVII